MPSNMLGQITYPFPNFNRCTIEVWEWTSNMILNFTMGVINHPYED